MRREEKAKILFPNHLLTRLNNKIFLAASYGHIYSFNIDHKNIVEFFYKGSYLDGLVAIYKTGKLFDAIEKQFIPGNGGAAGLNPNKISQKSVE